MAMVLFWRLAASIAPGGVRCEAYEPVASGTLIDVYVNVN
jgi:hypothetical protein